MAEKTVLTKGLAEVLETIKAAGNPDLTANEYAEQLGVKPSSVNARFNHLAKRGLGFREEVSVTNADGQEMTVKFLKLTDAGLNADIEVK